MKVFNCMCISACICMYRYVSCIYQNVSSCICLYLYVYYLSCIHCVCQDPPNWVPGSRPVNSVVPPPANFTQKKSAFNRSEFEVIAHHTVGATGDKHGDRMLEWATNPKFKARRIRYTSMKTMGKKAVDLNIPAGVLSRDFTERADGSQRLVFFFRSLYDAIKQLANNSRRQFPALLESSTLSLSWFTPLEISESMALSTVVKCMRLHRATLVQIPHLCQCF